MADEIGLPTEEVATAETIADIQVAVLRANETLTERADETERDGYEAAGVSFDLDEEQVAESLEAWLAALRTRVEELARQEGVESYTVSVTGGLTGVSVQLGLTYAAE